MSTSESESGSVSIGAKVSPALKRKIRVKAALEGKTTSEYLRELIEADVEDDRVARLLEEMDEEELEELVSDEE